jgi:hypothetical protein
VPQKASHTKTLGVATVSTSVSTLHGEASIDEFFDLVATETLALFEHLEFEVLCEFDVFAPGVGVEIRFRW